jgi:DNA-binding transcriptional MerR regulator
MTPWGALPAGTGAADGRDQRPGPDRGLPIGQVAERTGLSKDTLRYYEKAGLIEAIDRSPGGRRRYAVADLDWLAFLLRLRATGMSIADMQRFAELRRAGAASVAARQALLEAHREDLERHITTLQEHLAALSDKIDHYRELSGERIAGQAGKDPR